MKAIAANSLFGRIDSLFGETNSLFRLVREFGCNALELLRELMAAVAGVAENSQIPCCFPCSQGIGGGSQGGSRLIGAMRRRARHAPGSFPSTAAIAKA